MGIQINGNTNNINAGIGSLSIEDINELDIVGVATAANFKTGVSNLHNLGLTLSGGQLDVGSNIKIGNAGVITATSFVGSGANLTSLPAQATIANNADNRVITGGSGVNLNGESNLTFDGDSLLLLSSTDGRRVSFAGGGTSHYMKFDNTLNGIILNGYGGIAFETNGTNERLRIESGGDVSIGGMDANTFSNYRTFTIGGAGAVDGAGIDLERSDGNIYGRFFADANGIQIQSAQSGDSIRFETNGSNERVRITSDGKMGIKTSTPIGTLDVYDGTFVLSKPNASGNERNWRFVNNNVAAGNLGLQVSTAAGGSSFANLVEITKNGYIGIGEGTPDRRLHLKEPAQIKLESTSTGNWSGLEFMASSGTNNYDAYMGMNDSDGVFFIDNNSNGHDFIIDRDGRITKPNQPSCMAFNPNGQMIAGGATAAFSSTRFNIGSHYNTSNGRFTAPIAGRYLVAYSGLHDYQGQSQAGFSIQLNGSDFNGGEAYDDIYGSSDNHQCQLAKTLILNMSVNDYVSIYVRSSGTRIHQRYGSFSVCLLT